MTNATSLYPRLVRARLLEALADTPVVLLVGPRQAGKTTLVRQLSDQDRRYLTLDDETTLLAAREDPVGLVRGLDSAIIDEVQRVPQLLLAIKKSVDEDRRPGRFLLLYYRDHDQVEVDLVAENAAGRVVGVEVKAAATVRRNDLRGLKRLADLAGDVFRQGIILYDGSDVIPLGDRFRAVPLSTLWGR